MGDKVLFKCQKCESDLNGDFGMVACPTCGEINFLDDAPAGDLSRLAQNSSAAEPQEFNVEPGEFSLDETKPSIEALPEPRLEEIADFGNSQASNAPDGFLHYDLVISQIDSKEIRMEVIAALTDRKLGLTEEDILKRIKNGQILFLDLSPIKASQIVKKLRYIDVKINWTQKSLHLST